MITLHAEVQNKILTYSKRDGGIVCGNNDYQIEFAFDAEWDTHPSRVARFILPGGNSKDVAFEGNICKVPMISRVSTLDVGVFVDGELATTTAQIPCSFSVRCYSESEGFVDPPADPEGFVSGVWVFNETLPYEEVHFTGLNFTTNGGDLYKEIRMENGKPWYMDYRIDSLDAVTVWDDGSWLEEEYRTINFGTEPQEVSPEFYAWFTANAVKQ